MFYVGVASMKIKSTRFCRFLI